MDKIAIVCFSDSVLNRIPRDPNRLQREHHKKYSPDCSVKADRKCAHDASLFPGDRGGLVKRLVREITL